MVSRKRGSDPLFYGLKSKNPEYHFADTGVSLSFDQRRTKRMQNIANPAPSQILYLDTETTGLPPKGADWRTDYQDFPHIVSIAWSFHGEEHYYILNQEGRKIPDDATSIHGITTEQANKSEHFGPLIIGDFLIAAKNVDVIVGQNVYFDTAIIKANVLRWFGVDSLAANLAEEALHKSKRIDLIRVAQKQFGGRYLKLSEIHARLFDTPYVGHHALEDVRACRKCYEELMKRIPV